MNMFSPNANRKTWRVAGFMLAGLVAGATSRLVSAATAASSPALTTESAPVPAGSTVKSSTADILRMVDAKLDPEVIKAYIKASPTAYNLGASEIIALTHRGVPAEVLTAMLQHGSELKSQAPQANPVGGAPPAYPAAASPYSQPSPYPYDSGAMSPYPDSGYGYGGYPSYPYYYYGSGYGYPWAFYSPFFVGFNFGHSHFHNARFHDGFVFHQHRFPPMHGFASHPAFFPHGTRPFVAVGSFASRPASFAFHSGGSGMARAGSVGQMGMRGARR